MAAPRIADLAGSDFVVARSTRRWRTSELRLGGETIATLRMRGLVRWSCEARSSGGRWRFADAGFGVRAKRFHGNEEVARMLRSAGDPRATIEAGDRRLSWEPTSRARRAWSMRLEGAEVAYFRRRVPTFLEQLGVGVPVSARRVEDLDLLVLLGCYLTLTSPVRERQFLWPGYEGIADR